MKAKKIVTIILTVLIFLSAVVLGVSTVYRVDDVRVDIVALSEEGDIEAENLQARLKQAYYKQSIFFTEKTEAENALKDFPYLRLVSFTRSYPNLLVVTVSEDAEVYATPKDVSRSSYYILNAEGIVLGERNHYINRVDAHLQVKNILLTGRNGTTALSGEECIEKFFPFCQTLSSLLGGKIRANVLSIEYVAPTSQQEQSFFRLSMSEGVKIYLFNPAENVLEKATKAIEEYFALTDAQKMTGRIAVTEDVQGLRVDYSEKDGFADS